MKLKLLDLAILSLLAGAGPFAGAQPAAAPALPEDTRCDGDGCNPSTTFGQITVMCWAENLSDD